MYTERKKNLLPLSVARENQEGPRDGHNRCSKLSQSRRRAIHTWWYDAQHGTAQYWTLQSFFPSKLAAETKQQQNLKGKTKESPMPLSRRKIHVCESHKKPNAKWKIQAHWTEDTLLREESNSWKLSAVVFQSNNWTSRLQILTEQIPRKSVIAIANGTKSKHSQTRKRMQRRTTNAIFPPAPESGYQSGYKTPASAPPIESKRDNLGGCVGIGWGQGPEYNRRIFSTYVSAPNASLLLILDPGIKTLLSAARRIESGQSRGDAWASGGARAQNITGGSSQPTSQRQTPLSSWSSTRTCSPNGTSSLVPLDAGIIPGTRTRTAIPAMRDDMGPGDAWASVGCQL